ncbi:MAG: hypothetical protein IPP71_10030 [Bacteroidetes bacterium]|nr:hypothetical protein [Bacteroidota bacterium]
MKVESIQFLKWSTENIFKSNAFIVKPDIRRKENLSEQQRINPESLYRKKYWVYQFKMIEEIGERNPKILIINDDLEIKIFLHSDVKRLLYTRYKFIIIEAIGIIAST